MPSPKMSRPADNAGELTVGSFNAGAPLDHSVRCGALSTVLTQTNVGRVKAARPDTYIRPFSTTAAATKWSLPLRTQRTAGVSGPALPSVLPVRWLLPR